MLLLKRYYKPCPDLESFTTVRDFIRNAKEVYTDKLAFRQYETRTTETGLSFRGFNENIDALGTELLDRGLGGKHFAFLGETSIEWLTAFFAVICGVGVAIPIDKELMEDTMVHQLNFGDAEVLVVSGNYLKKAPTLLARCPKIKTLIVLREKFSKIPLENDWLSFENLVSTGHRKQMLGNKSYVDAELDPQKMAVIIYTSGTTGANKGVMLCHKNFVSCIQGARRLIHYPETNISLLPINHSYELTCNIIGSLYEGSSMSINDDLKHVLQSLNHFAPEMTCMVPTMLDLMVRRTKRTIEQSGLSGYVKYSFWLSAFLRKFGFDWRRQMFKPILEKFGGNLKKIICGGAPLSDDTLNFMDSIGVTILNGYGITECAPLVAVNSDKMRKRGSVGKVLPSCKVRIAEPDEKGHGEIQVKGGNVMLGYYKMPEDTAKVFTEDGWFKTGDIGRLDRDDFLYISGRIKNLIILANGKNIFPEEVEEHLVSAIPYIEEVVVFADDANTGIYAMCYLNPEFCHEHGLETEEQQSKYLNADIIKYNQHSETYKRVSNAYISMHEFEKTTTHKIKRNSIDRSTVNV